MRREAERIQFIRTHRAQRTMYLVFVPLQTNETINKLQEAPGKLGIHGSRCDKVRGLR